MDASNTTWIARLRRAFDSVSGKRPSAVRARYDEILSDTARTLSLDELLVLFPERVSAALNLSSFDIFVRDGNEFRLERPGRRPAEPAIAFAASGSTVSRMKRERKPATFIDPDSAVGSPEGWQLLATSAEITALQQLNARHLLPLEGRTGLMGFVVLSPQPGRALTPSELSFLRELGPQMGRGLETAQFLRTLSDEAIHRAHVQRELELAREVQARLLPLELPSIQGLDVAAFYKSAEEVGGDYYDLFHTQSGLLCCVVADVSGKGISSALLMATLRATLHTLMLAPVPDAVEIVTRLNNQLYQASSMARYATFFFSLYDPADCTLTYVNAGHNPPLLLRADGTFERLTLGGAVVGLLPSVVYQQDRLSLAPGDQIIAYTDGITEAVDLHGKEWEEAGLVAALERQQARTADETLAYVRGALETFTTGAAQADDMTLLILSRR